MRRTTHYGWVAAALFTGAAIAQGCSGSSPDPGNGFGFGGGDDGSTGTGAGSSSSGGSGSSSSGQGASSGSQGGSSGSSGGSASSGGAASSSSSGAGHDAGGSSSGASSSGAGSSSSSSSGAHDAGVSADVSVSADAGADALSFQEYNLMLINMYRAMASLPPLTLDPTLSAFALAGSQELTMDHLPHQHFINAGNAIFTMGFNTMAGENQGDPNGWRVLSTSDPVANEEMQIAQILQAMFNEGPPGDAGDHGHYENIMSTSFTKVGIGLIEVNGKLYLTNDFSN